MNKQEILDEIAELKERLNSLEKMYNSLTPPNKRWRAKKGDCYYYMNHAGAICSDTEGEQIKDTHRYRIGNYFETVYDADFERERLKVIAELREWATPADDFDFTFNTNEIKKYIIVLESDKITVEKYYAYQPSELCFISREMATNAINAVGEERIIKYYFRKHCDSYKTESGVQECK